MAVVTFECREKDRPAGAVRDAASQLVGGVSIVAAGTAPNRVGFTTTSVVGLPADPHRILLVVENDPAAIATMRRCRAFSVNILGEHHQWLADRFFGCVEETREEQFSYKGACWHDDSSDAPVLCDALAVLNCALEEVIDRGPLTLAIGRIVMARASGVGQPLLHWRGRYDHTCERWQERDLARWAPLL